MKSHRKMETNRRETNKLKKKILEKLEGNMKGKQPKSQKPTKEPFLDM